jgi:hypothetical protein
MKPFPRGRRRAEDNPIIDAINKARRLSQQMHRLDMQSNEDLVELVEHFERQLLANRRAICSIRDEQLRRVGLP